MARGIIVKRPGGGSPNGRLITSEVIADPTGRMPAVPPGNVVEFPPDDSSDVQPNIGDVVDFTYDPATGKGSALIPAGRATVYSSEETLDLDIVDGEFVLLSGAKIEGGINVNSGVLAIANGSSFSGKIKGVTAESTIIVNGSTTEGKIESNNGGYLAMDTVNKTGKVTSTGNAYTSVQNCTIAGKLEVLRATQCVLRNNTVQGQTNTDCR